ncbi:iminophenyl-pyruvate dimer synthase VioB [Pseudoalteromonas sp. SMS1]|uniref:iminophenyl-pyruvate dimer synthase VioB n=1 Tax=Pseudoalteromonas sp. SMS1 TaxID=2908894 RepID=UPI001F448994|nr:iminophenyl-pyruvate dimer synthase VioB [Pseudoalteromonas sp. SMS1]MCF2857085.1 iminophenyl-pyruvate dimer synthase VioB [Pseudoalteromonas sp. SMS1]
MSILDFPRVHFKGIARVNVPTANRNINNTLDITNNMAIMDGAPYDVSQPPSRFHDYLNEMEPKFNAQGIADESGPFNLAAGYNMRGNNHFSWENTLITSVQLKPGEYITNDKLVGSKLSLWGHYNEYLRTSFNRARWVDSDPTRRDSALIYAGQLTITDPKASANTTHILSADIDCTHGVRWMNKSYIVQPVSHFMYEEMSEARLFQFSIRKDSDAFLFNQLGLESALLDTLKEALADPDVLGLTVQYCVSNLSPPVAPNMPVFCDLHGTIGLWRNEDMMTSPTGRILRPDNSEQYAPIAISIGEDWLSLNAAIGIPHNNYEEALPVSNGMPPKLSAKVNLGNLYLKSNNGQIIATITEQDYLNNDVNSGVIDIPLQQLDEQYHLQSLRLCSAMHTWYESDWHIQAEKHIFSMESPNHLKGEKSTVAVSIRSYFHGKPMAITKLASHVRDSHTLSCDQYINTDLDGRGTLTIESLKPGSTELFLGEYHNPVLVRVLPSDWELMDTPTEQVDYDYLYKHVMAYYELFYPFMTEAVFSMADKCKCETYARLMWQMCDPRNRDKSYYMPSTREMPQAHAQLFLKYLCNVEQSAMPKVLPPQAPQFHAKGNIKNKSQLIKALRDAVDLELSIMLQYLYSAYSLPNYGVGEHFVSTQRWTQAQLELVNGTEDRRRNSGWRGALLEIAHEEMIHYLVVNNLLMALGEAFYPGQPVLGEAAKDKFGLDTEFSFEPFSEHVIAKFVRFEWPAFFPTVGKSIADFYHDITLAIKELPDLFSAEKVNLGGEHHLFLNEIINREYPGYQFEVYDRETAIFAINFVTEQGEGVSADSEQFEVSHFNRLRTISKTLTNSDIPFEPAYPVLKNPVFEARNGCNLVTDPEAKELMAFYKGCHELMFQLMMQHFAVKPLGSMRRSRLMNGAIDLMTGILRPLSVQLMSLPSGIPGRNAGPPVPEAISADVFDDLEQGCMAISRRCEELVSMAKNMVSAMPPQTQIELLEFFQNQMHEIATGKLSREA